jgi:cysteine synthase A
MVCAARGYKLILTMPDSASDERRMLLKAFGAELVLTPGAEGMAGAVRKAEQISESLENSYMPQQFKNKANPAIHRKTTAKEIMRSLDRIDAFVAGVGSGGTITGVGGALKRKFPEVKIVAVEPDESPVLSGGEPHPHSIQGIGAGFVPDIFDRSVCDKIVRVRAKDAAEASRELARKEGILAGISSGAAVWAAMGLARELGPGKKIVVLLPDTGERYLSTDLFGD